MPLINSDVCDSRFVKSQLRWINVDFIKEWGWLGGWR